MRCPYCATDNRPHARFCRVCGQILTDVVTASSAPLTQEAGTSPEATLELPWPLAEHTTSAPTVPAPAESNTALAESAATLNESANRAPVAAVPTESDSTAAETDPATLEFPTDFAGASAVAVQENAAESHADHAFIGRAATEDSSIEMLPGDATITDSTDTSSTVAADNTAGSPAGDGDVPITDSIETRPPGAADNTAGESAGDQTSQPEGRSAADPPPVGLAPGTTDESLASPPSSLPPTPAADVSAAPDSIMSADSAVALSAAPPPAITGAEADDAVEDSTAPTVISAPAADGVEADALRDLVNDAGVDLPLATEGNDMAPSLPGDESDATAVVSLPGDDSDFTTPQIAPSDEIRATTNLPTPDRNEHDPADLSVAQDPPLQVAASEPQTAPTPFGEPPTLADSADTSVDPSSPPAAVVGAATTEGGSLSAEAATSHLREDDAPAVAAPVPGEAFPALQPGAVVAGRYTITQVVQTGPQRQTYLATDGQGYLRCWACGSRDNIQGELYCTNCGAQLTGRSYRLFETPPGTEAGEIAAPLLENLHSGVAGVFDSLTDSANGRHYLVLEDVGGKSLAVALAPPTGSADEPPTAAHLLTWIAAATQTLAELHAAQVVGCDFTPQALGVLPDDRLVLVDPSACRMTEAAGEGHSASAEQQADVQRVAATLEQWLTANAPADENTAALTPAVAPTAARPTAHTEDTIHTILAQGREGAYKTAAELAAAVHDLLAADQPPADLQLISGRATDVGVQRKLNEDSLFALETVTIETSRSTPTALYIVADGMGGHESGEVASSIAVRTIPAMLNSLLDARVHGDSPTPDQATLDEAVREAILEANRRIAELGRQRQSDMGTTVTMALVLGNSVTVANVGDSRTYLWRDGKLHQISEDHSLVARLIAAGQLTAEEGRHFERRNEIYRALGDGHLTPADVDVFHAQLRPLDALVLCSDGLWEMVRDADIEQIMLDAPDPPAATQALIAAANKAGGEDNITVIIAQTLTSSEDADA